MSRQGPNNGRTEKRNQDPKPRRSETEIRCSKAAVKAVNGSDKLPLSDIKTMQGYTDGRQRLRVGKYRIIYRYGFEMVRQSDAHREAGARPCFR